jgi:hypothetical protein
VAKSWREIKEFYEELGNYGPPVQGTVRLVGRILTSHYPEGLFAWTSMSSLCVAKHRPPCETPVRI